ncbi:hypothetical protein C8R43DRAFT_1017919 [Mycena crocata]|nr:hypothetical protein C8R43DRAFT_1017919 [Mycena crocata]
MISGKFVNISFYRALIIALSLIRSLSGCNKSPKLRRDHSNLKLRSVASCLSEPLAIQCTSGGGRGCGQGVRGHMLD